MKVFTIFDSSAGTYQVKEAIEDFKSIKGVKSIEIMEKVAGEVPRYNVAYEIEDDGAEETGEALKQAISQYSQYMSNLAWGAYKNIG